ncbi:MAG: hypothetical protein HKN80_04320 [Acidimicrobiia bacterium]|nr:hypothetical protein [Acidimicrobiia bacterium]
MDEVGLVVGDGGRRREDCSGGAAQEVWSRSASVQPPGRAAVGDGLVYSPPHPPETAIEISPALFLTTWASGLAIGAAIVAGWRVVGPGFGWLSAGVVVLFGGTGWAVGGGWPAGLGTLAAVVAFALARRSGPSVVALLVSGALYVAASVPDGGLLGTLSGAVLLGGVTTEMLLGHWYLIDPALPRWALKRLAAIGAVGVVADAIVLGVDAGTELGAEVVGWAFLVLAITTLALMAAVWFALNEPSYPGVMAATGLSYLAILTAIGAAAAGRALVDEGTSLLGADLVLDTIALL